MNMLINKLKNHLLLDEGYRQFPYKCSAGKLTIGIGRNIEDVGITKEEADYLLENDIMEVITDLRKIFENFDNLPEEVIYVLCNMRFQLGYGTFRKFKNFIKAVKKADWFMASEEMQRSRWYQQTKKRAERLISIMRNI